MPFSFHCICTGQFWNVPITVIDIGGVINDVTVNGRRFFTIRNDNTYDGTNKVCYYVPSSVTNHIEGSYDQYVTNSLFATSYTYTLFDDGRCYN